jgi:hypothetical protein
MSGQVQVHVPDTTSICSPAQMTDIKFFPVSKTPANEKDKRKEVGTEDELPDMSKLDMVRTGSSIRPHDSAF